MALSALRKAVYSNMYFVGFQNKSFLYYYHDLSSLTGKKLTKNVESEKSVGGKSLNVPLTMDFSNVRINRAYYLEPKKAIVTTYVDDSFKSCRYYNEDSYRPIDEFKVINGWRCQKWEPKGVDVQGQVSVWISKDVPVEINLGIVCEDFSGGVVAIEWENGRYNVLESFKESRDYEFNPSMFRKPKFTTDVDRAIGIRSGLYDDISDSMGTKLELKE